MYVVLLWQGIHSRYVVLLWQGIHSRFVVLLYKGCVLWFEVPKGAPGVPVIEESLLFKMRLIRPLHLVGNNLTNPFKVS